MGELGYLGKSKLQAMSDALIGKEKEAQRPIRETIHGRGIWRQRDSDKWVLSKMVVLRGNHA